MSQSNPTFADITNLLDALVPTSDSNIEDAPHEAFWRNKTRDAFVALTTAVWGVAGNLVTPGNEKTSNLYLALSGQAPFDGSQVPQMPDVNSDPNARVATAAEIAMVAAWIRNNAPA